MSNRELTKCERAAMWKYADEYSKGKLGAIEFWQTLDDHRKNLIREMVRDIENCLVFEVAKSPTAIMERHQNFSRHRAGTEGEVIEWFKRGYFKIFIVCVCRE
jgi:hypothetical protein